MITHELYSVKYWIFDVKGFGSSIHSPRLCLGPEKKKKRPFIQTSHFFKYIFHAVFRIITQKHIIDQLSSLCTLFVSLQWLLIQMQFLTYHKEDWWLDFRSLLLLLITSPGVGQAQNCFWLLSQKLQFLTFIYCFKLLPLHQINYYSFLIQLFRRPSFGFLNATGWDWVPFNGLIFFRASIIPLNLLWWFQIPFLIIHVL